MRHYRYHIWPSHVVGRIDQIHRQIGQRQPDKVTMFAPEEWMYDYKKYARWEHVDDQALNREFDLLLGSFENEEDKLIYPEGTNLIYWPTFWIYATWDQCLYQRYARDISNITKPFLCLNNMPHWFRCAMIDEMSRRQLIDKGIITWHQPDVDFNWKHWKPKKLIIDPLFNAENVDGYRYSDEMQAALNSTFMSLVLESTLQRCFLTEKTFQQIMQKRIFLTFGAPSIYKHMDELGFKRFDEIFDYSFDEEKDYIKRGSMILDQVESIVGRDYQTISEKLLPKIEHNFKLMNELALDTDSVPSCVKEVVNEHPSFNFLYNRISSGSI